MQLTALGLAGVDADITAIGTCSTAGDHSVAADGGSLGGVDANVTAVDSHTVLHGAAGDGQGAGSENVAALIHDDLAAGDSAILHGRGAGADADVTSVAAGLTVGDIAAGDTQRAAGDLDVTAPAGLGGSVGTIVHLAGVGQLAGLAEGNGAAGEVHGASNKDVAANAAIILIDGLILIVYTGLDLAIDGPAAGDLAAGHVHGAGHIDSTALAAVIVIDSDLVAVLILFDGGGAGEHGRTALDLATKHIEGGAAVHKHSAASNSGAAQDGAAVHIEDGFARQANGIAGSISCIAQVRSLRDIDRAGDEVQSGVGIQPQRHAGAVILAVHHLQSALPLRGGIGDPQGHIAGLVVLGGGEHTVIAIGNHTAV